MRILFAASEGLPFSKTGGLADVVEALPKALVAGGHEVAVVLPRYRGTQASAVVIPSLTVPMGNRLRFPAIVDGTLLNGVRYFFVDDPAYFDRDGIYGNAAGDFAGWFEAYLGGRWYTFDARNNIPRIGRVLIAQGRDAADVPITQTFGPNTLVSFKVWTDEVV